ncbi:MAG: hypothetical protein NZ918_01555, partial [Aigarchaeota archaeon]|nr:hypothetical protein [Aigarchaeota archaeon]
YYPPGHKVYEGAITKYNKSTFKANVSVVSSWTIIVKDGKGGDLVPNANVTMVLPANKSIKYSKLTDSDGEVAFGPIPFGDYEITVRYGDIQRKVTERPKVVGETVESLSLTLPLYRVTLVVKDVNGVPVKDVGVELKPELDEDAIASSTTNADGEAVLKLIPNGEYYAIAYLKDIKVYESKEKEIRVSNNYMDKTIEVNASKANITIYDYDGEGEIKNYPLKGELIRDGKIIYEVNSADGVLRFGHVPFTSYTLKIHLGEIQVYSGVYEVNKETSRGSIKAWFHDAKIEVNASILANETMAKSLRIRFHKGPVEIEVQTKEGRAILKDVPRAEGYLATLFYQDKEVGRISNINILKEDQFIKLNLTGYRINFTTLNLDDEPISVEIQISLPGGEKILSMKTASDGSGSSGILLPLTYEISAYLGGIKVGEQRLMLASDIDLPMRLSVINPVFRILDKDGEENLTNIDLKLIHGSLELGGTSDENGSIRVRNVPAAQYRVIANYHGFKVLDRLIDVEPNTREIKLQAPGVLDVKLVMLDGLKKPLDQGMVIFSFGEAEISEDISTNGEVVAKNLPNTTISIQVLYRGIKVTVDPEEFDLAGDEMRITCTTSVYMLTVRVLRGDGEPVNEGEVVISVDGKVTVSHDLRSDYTFSERLPKGDVIIKVRYRDREAGFMNIYLEQPVNDVTIHSTLYPLKLRVYSPEGRPVEGAELIIRDELGEIGRAQSKGDGLIEVILPVGDYNASIKIGNDTYSFEFELRASRSINFLYPVSKNYGFEISVAAGAVNLAISSFAVSRISRERPRRAPERGVARRPRKVPRV